jgi:hypothetical protein
VRRILTTALVAVGAACDDDDDAARPGATSALAPSTVAPPPAPVTALAIPSDAGVATLGALADDIDGRHRQCQPDAGAVESS